MMPARMGDGLKSSIPCLTLNSAQHLCTPQRYSDTAPVLLIYWSSKLKSNLVIGKERGGAEEEKREKRTDKKKGGRKEEGSEKKEEKEARCSSFSPDWD